MCLRTLHQKYKTPNIEFMRHYNILNIVAEETIMFNTKERCLFSVSLEVYNPMEVLDEKERKQFELDSQGPITIYNSMPKYRLNSTLTSPPPVLPPQRIFYLTQNPLRTLY